MSPLIIADSCPVVLAHALMAGSMFVTITFMVATLLLFAAIGWQRWQRARRIERMRQREIERNTPRRLRKKTGV